MFRKLTFLAIAGFLILDQASYVLSRQLNFTQLENLFNPELYHHQILRDIPVEKQVSFLSEEDDAYDVENSNNPRQMTRHSRESDQFIQKYQHLCKTQTKLVEIKDDVYEYQPSFYHETYCMHPHQRDNEQEQQKCVHPGFHCVQKTQRMNFLKRPWASAENCWEVDSKNIASGCDCMWPVTILGNIFDHY